MNKNLFIPMFLVALSASAQTPAAKPTAEPAAIAKNLDGPIARMEQEFVSAAEAMPEDKYNFAPTQGEFKGVRTFGQQVKHIASANYMFGAFILQEKAPSEGGENGPDAIKTKAEILKYLKDSFSYVHKAVLTIDDQNALKPEKALWGGGTTTRLTMATFVLGHGFDHYGQIVVYLRMNGIVPPASRQN